jgi:hypothetical protein
MGKEKLISKTELFKLLSTPSAKRLVDLASEPEALEMPNEGDMSAEDDKY